MTVRVTTRGLLSCLVALAVVACSDSTGAPSDGAVVPETAPSTAPAAAADDAADAPTPATEPTTTIADVVPCDVEPEVMTTAEEIDFVRTPDA